MKFMNRILFKKILGVQIYWYADYQYTNFYKFHRTGVNYENLIMEITKCFIEVRI